MNKASGEKNLYRGLGSIDIAAIARSVLMISRDRDNPSLRYMLPVKSSLAPEGSAIAFSIDSQMRLKWVGGCDVDKRRFLSDDIGCGKKAVARRIIREMLCEKDSLSADILRKLDLTGISKRTISTAKKELGVLSYRKGKSWYWHLPEQPSGN